MGLTIVLGDELNRFVVGDWVYNVDILVRSWKVFVWATETTTIVSSRTLIEPPSSNVVGLY